MANKLMTVLPAIVSIAFSLTSHAEPSKEYIKAHAIPGTGEEVPSQLLNDLKSKRLVLIGELHGTRQMPVLAGQILEGLAKEKKVALGIEFPIDIQPEVDRFMRSGDVTELRSTRFFQDVNYGSGRATLAMIELLKMARRLKVPVFCFDGPSRDRATARDTVMAEHVLSYMLGHPKLQLITYSGNLHSRLDEKFMGAEIVRLSTGILTKKNTDNIIIRPGGGSAWNCISGTDGKIDCGIHSSPQSNDVYSTAIDSFLYYLPEKEPHLGHNKTLYIRSIGASLPISYFKNGCQLTGPTIQSYLEMDYDSFDQSLPEGGWRALPEQGCELEAAGLIDIYHLHNWPILKGWQHSVLYWHAGQLYAFQDNRPLAIGRFRSSLHNSDSSDQAAWWNAYAKGSIAFLENNREELQRNRDVLAKLDPAGKNLSILNNFLTCMGKPYKRAYSGPCEN